MKSDIDLLNLYKEEKTLVIGPMHLRTGLEDFPSFKEWKLDYMKEYAETHDMNNPVSMEEAVALLEAELDAEVDDLLPDEDLAVLTATETPETPDEETEMTDEVTTEVTNAAEVLVGPETTEAEAPAKPKRAKKPAATAAKPKKAKAEKRPPSKAGEAQKVFDRLYPKVLEGKKARKDVIEEFVSKVGLTPNGASTYFQKMKTAYGKK
jgi:hypothetical protein